MKLSHVFAFLVSCLTFVAALGLIYHQTDLVMTFSGWSLISYICYLIAITGENENNG
jgi:NADH:ubiquinone oxidoreductase subunit 2 (subunit N)